MSSVATPRPSTASSTAVATPPPSDFPSHHAQHASITGLSNSQMAATAQGATPAAANGVPHEHTRKPSVVISATGASGYTQNGNPVGQTGRPPINFGMMNAVASSPGQQSNLPVQDQQASLQTPSENPRVISPAHSPSPIPQPNASGGRPPSSLQSQGNGLNFGSMGGDATAQGQPGQFGANAAQTHERRLSSQSLHGSDSGMGRGFTGPQAGRGRGFAPQFNPMGSPAQTFRQMSNQGRPAMNPQFSSGNLPPNAQYGRPPNRQQSPAVGYAQPQAPYGAYPQQMYTQGYDPYSGYFQPYTAQYPYGAPGPSPSPRPQYPNPYTNTAGSNQPPFMPPNMARTPSQASDRPGSSIGHPGTPSQSHVTPSQQGAQQAASATSNFVRPVKKSNAIKITNDKGEAVTFTKPAQSPALATQQAAASPVIVATPSAPTPPPRVPSAQHTRTESKSVMSQDETREAFKEQVKRQMAAQRGDQDSKSVDGDAHDSAVKSEPVKEAVAGAEKAVVAASEDKAAEKTADTAIEAEQETDAERKTREQREEDERFEREIAEMEAKEREEEEREKAFQEKRQREKEAAAKKEAESKNNADDELKRQEREAEERELQRERERESEKTSQEPDDDAKALFASLKRPTLGPGATTSEADDQASSEEAAAESTSTESATTAAPSTARSGASQKQKPANLKLDTIRKVEPAEPTPGMQALKSARFLEVKEEALYPEGIKSPNPALNANGTKKARAYDKEFLLQFQNVFKEKPSIDWDQKVRDTLGPSDEPGSARSSSARTPSSSVGRSASSRGAQGAGSFGGAMGAFGSLPGGRTLPAGTTSEQRFLASQGSGSRTAMPAQIARLPSNMGMGGGLNRTNSSLAMGPNSSRQPSSRGGRGASKRDNRQPSRKEEAELANRMPLTAGLEVKELEKSASGWTASSITQGPMANAPTLDGHMAPDMVQRKVKAALNKMTPEKFDKISDQILEIASQSKNESDGRTLRQVIQLTFEKACDEAHWAGMYAQFCHKMLTTMSPEIRDETIKDKSGAPVVGGALFRKYLLNRCQEDFERGWQVNLPDKPDGDESQEAALLSDEYYVAAAAKRKGLGLIQFIGQLYKLGMLTIRIMHQCVMRLLNFEGDPDEAAVENLTTLLRSVGATMDADQQQGRALVDTYFARIEEKVVNNSALASRPKFMVLDLMDLRKASWQGKGDTKGPKTIQQIHQEAEAAQAKAELERQRTRAGAGRGGGRQDSRNFSGQMAPPIDYNRINVSTDDLRRLQNRNASQRSTGGGLGPGGSLGPSSLGARAGSRRGNLGPSGSGNSTRTSTPPVGDKDKKDEPAQQNSFSALENLENEEVESPEANRDRSKSPLPSTEKADQA